MSITSRELPNSIRTAAFAAALLAVACSSAAPSDPVAAAAPAPTSAPAAAPAAPSPPAAPTDPAAPVEYKNTIRWSTASEVENFAYDVYRGDSEDGPFVRITSSPIPGAGTTDETTKYTYVDRDIDPRKAYYYYVESISLGGVREKFTPISRAAPKLPGKAPGQE